MKLISSLDGVYTARTGAMPDQWYGAGLYLPDLDRPWLDQIEAVFFPEKDFSTDGMSLDAFYASRARHADSAERLPEAWVKSVAEQKRTLVYFDESRQIPLAVADRIYGPCIPSGVCGRICVGWIEKNDEVRTLKAYDGHESRVILTSQEAMACPDCAAWQGAFCFAFTQGGTTVILHENGEELCRFSGKYPRLAACGDELFCVYEKADRQSGHIELILRNILTGSETVLPGEAINLHARILTHENRMFIAYESRPAWGVDQCLTQTSTLRLSIWEKGTLRCLEAPLNRMGYREFSTDEIQSVHMGYPQLFVHGDSIGIAVRRYRVEKFRTNNWDVYVSFLGEGGLTLFQRITINPGASDTELGLFDWNGQLCCTVPCHDECAMSREFNTRLEIINTQNEFLPPIDPSMSVRASYQVAPGAEGIGLAPAIPLSVPGYHYAEADIHAHSVYSKCSASIDGAPDETARWYIDLLGMQAVCLTDHTDRIGYVQYTWLTDRMEELADGCADLLYGIEPSIVPDHDTIFYTTSRQHAELVRLASLYSLRRDHVYHLLRAYLPDGSVAAIRHCHGRNGTEDGIHSLKTLTTFAPDLEWAMEALQLRGNILLGEGLQNAQEQFPANFLNTGAKIGVTGGTDHDSHVVVNHMGYTGFWCTSNGPNALLDALRHRRTYAVSNGHAQIWAELDGRPMGAELSVRGPVEINVRIHAARPIRRVALLKDGVRMPWQNVPAACEYEGVLRDEQPGSGEHWYCAIAECESIFSVNDTAQSMGGRLLLGGFRMMMPRNEYCTVIASPFFVNTLSSF